MEKEKGSVKGDVDLGDEDESARARGDTATMLMAFFVSARNYFVLPRQGREIAGVGDELMEMRQKHEGIKGETRAEKGAGARLRLRRAEMR